MGMGIGDVINCMNYPAANVGEDTFGLVTWTGLKQQNGVS